MGEFYVNGQRMSLEDAVAFIKEALAAPREYIPPPPGMCPLCSNLGWVVKSEGAQWVAPCACLRNDIPESLDSADWGQRQLEEIALAKYGFNSRTK